MGHAATPRSGMWLVASMHYSVGKREEQCIPVIGLLSRSVHMNPSDEIRSIINDIAQVKASGVASLPIEKLEEYLAQRLDIATAMETEAGQIAVQTAEHNLEIWKVQTGAQSAVSVEMFKAVVEAGQTSLKALMLMNGGAAAALLAFCGNAITKGQSFAGDPLLASIGIGLAWFVAGMGAAGLATGFRYFAQYCFARTPVIRAGSRWFVAGTTFNIAAILIALFGFMAFCAGGTRTYTSITSPPSSVSNQAFHSKILLV